MRNSSGHEKNVRGHHSDGTFKARQESSQVGWPGVVTGRTRLRAPGRKGASGPRSREQAGKVLDGGQSRDAGMWGHGAECRTEFIPGPLGKYWRALK